MFVSAAASWGNGSEGTSFTGKGAKAFAQTRSVCRTPKFKKKGWDSDCRAPCVAPRKPQLQPQNRNRHTRAPAGRGIRSRTDVPVIPEWRRRSIQRDGGRGHANPAKVGRNTVLSALEARCAGWQPRPHPSPCHRCRMQHHQLQHHGCTRCRPNEWCFSAKCHMGRIGLSSLLWARVALSS